MLPSNIQILLCLRTKRMNASSGDMCIFSTVCILVIEILANYLAVISSKNVYNLADNHGICVLFAFCLSYLDCSERLPLGQIVFVNCVEGWSLLVLCVCVCASFRRGLRLQISKIRRDAFAVYLTFPVCPLAVFHSSTSIQQLMARQSVSSTVLTPM